jgi:hypothetical protein
MSPIAILAVFIMTCDFLLIVAFQWLYGNGRRKRVEGIVLLKHKPKVLKFPATPPPPPPPMEAGIARHQLAEHEELAYRRIAASFAITKSRA